MDPKAGSIGRIGTAGLQISFVTFECLLDADQFAIIGILVLAAPRKDPSAILSLPEIQDEAAVSLLEVVRRGKRLCPVPAFAVGSADDPSTGSPVAPIT